MTSITPLSRCSCLAAARLKEPRATPDLFMTRLRSVRRSPSFPRDLLPARRDAPRCGESVLEGAKQARAVGKDPERRVKRPCRRRGQAAAARRKISAPVPKRACVQTLIWGRPSSACCNVVFASGGVTRPTVCSRQPQRAPCRPKKTALSRGLTLENPKIDLLLERKDECRGADCRLGKSRPPV